MLIGALVTGACTNDPQEANVAVPAVVTTDQARCETVVKAAEARRLADERLADTLVDIDVSARKAGELRRTLPVTHGDIDVLAGEVARLHAKVDRDMNRLAAARASWEAAKRTLETDVIALDQAIYNFEHATPSPVSLR